jgi:hypothetical protein
MENFIIYIAKASGLIALFLIAYYALLRKETFFASNRGFLMAGLLTSALLPFARYTKVIWVDPAPKSEVAEQAVQTVNLDQLMMMQQQMIASAKAHESFTINWWYVACAIYAIGMLFFFTRFIIDFIAIRRILKGNAIIKEGRYKLIDSKKVSSPFSFFNYIVYNSAVLNTEELESIISHEKVHSRQRHSADMIISQLFCIAFWFNPLVWLYKRSISQNLEFIADAVAIRQLADKKSYQKTLLKITLQPECIAITNHFYQSLIKKRIVMLNKKQSKRRNSWKYAIILPALAAFMLAFQVKVVAQEKATTISTASDEKTKVSVSIEKDATDKELAEEVKIFKDEFDADITFSNIKRNASGEITSIKVNVKDKTQSRDFMMMGNGKPIVSFNIEIEKNGDATENKIFFGNPGKNVSISAGTISVASNTANDTEPNFIARTSDDEDNASGNAGSATINPYKGALIIVNGVKQEKNTDVTQFQVPKGQSISYMNTLTPKEAKKKYGKEGKKGAVEIGTVKTPRNVLQISPNYTYKGDDEGQDMGYEMPPMPPMPPMEDIMSYARMGVNEGMKALSEIDWQKEMDFKGLSEEDRKEIQEEMKKARIEVEKAMNDPEIRKEMDEARSLSLARGMKAGAERGRAESIRKMSDSERLRADKERLQVQKELLQTKKELMKTEMELQKMKMELERDRQKLKKKSN